MHGEEDTQHLPHDYQRNSNKKRTRKVAETTRARETAKKKTRDGERVGSEFSETASLVKSAATGCENGL
jgi:ribosome assembly protein YihI (activator of Der GTPase)